MPRQSRRVNAAIYQVFRRIAGHRFCDLVSLAQDVMEQIISTGSGAGLDRKSRKSRPSWPTRSACRCRKARADRGRGPRQSGRSAPASAPATSRWQSTPRHLRCPEHGGDLRLAPGSQVRFHLRRKADTDLDVEIGRRPLPRAVAQVRFGDWRSRRSCGIGCRSAPAGEGPFVRQDLLLGRHRQRAGPQARDGRLPAPAMRGRGRSPICCFRYRTRGGRVPDPFFAGHGQSEWLPHGPCDKYSEFVEQPHGHRKYELRNHVGLSGGGSSADDDIGPALELLRPPSTTPTLTQQHQRSYRHRKVSPESHGRTWSSRTKRYCSISGAGVMLFGANSAMKWNTVRNTKK